MSVPLFKWAHGKHQGEWQQNIQINLVIFDDRLVEKLILTLKYYTQSHWLPDNNPLKENGPKYEEQMLDQRNNKHAQALSWASLPLHTDKTVWTHFESQIMTTGIQRLVICKKLYWLRNLEVNSPTVDCRNILTHWTASRTDTCHCFPQDDICPLAPKADNAGSFPSNGWVHRFF